jgi:hypothetical protein
LWIHYFLRFLCIHKSSIRHIRPGCVPSFHGCEWPFYLGFSKFVELSPPLVVSTTLLSPSQQHSWLFSTFYPWILIL